jgi:hypothetical protein
MKHRSITVTGDYQGRPITRNAELIICDKCGCETFVIFVLRGSHQHIQCSACHNTYCNGQCALLSPEEAFAPSTPLGHLQPPAAQPPDRAAETSITHSTAPPPVRKEN